MLKRFYPDEYLDSTYSIDFKQLFEEGYRGLIFDIDNTLVPHGAPADYTLFWNQLPRVELFNKDVQVHFIENAHKPSVKNYRKAMEIMETNVKNTIFIGDQIFTDIYGAKRAGIRTILVKPIHPKEEIQIVLKRYLEKIVLFFYKRRNKRWITLS